MNLPSVEYFKSTIGPIPSWTNFALFCSDIVYSYTFLLEPANKNLFPYGWSAIFLNPWFSGNSILPYSELDRFLHLTKSSAPKLIIVVFEYWFVFTSMSISPGIWHLCSSK